MPTLPIPEFSKDVTVLTGGDIMCLISRDPNAGRKDAYTVLKVNRRTGRAGVIGREVDLKFAKKLAGDACDKAFAKAAAQ